MPHRTLVNLTTWQHGELGPGGTTLQFAPLSFDVSFQEIFSTLCAGAILILAPETLRQDPVGLWRLIGERKVNRLYLPFVALQQLAEAAAHIEPLPATLREIITAGEQLQVTPPIRNLFRTSLDASCIIITGPSETHVVTAYTLAGPPERLAASASIGHPIANTSIHLLDPDQRPVPIGVPGEMYIAGDNLCAGLSQTARGTYRRKIRYRSRLSGSTPLSNRAISPAIFPAATSNFLAVSTTRSRFAVFGLSQARWRRCLPAIQRCLRPSS